MDTEIIVARAEIELEQEGKDLDWSSEMEMQRVIEMIIEKCDENEWEISRAAVAELFRSFSASP